MPTCIRGQVRQADVHPHMYGNVTDCQCLSGMQCYEGQVKRYFRRIYLSPSLTLPLYSLCDSWPRGHLPHCAFVPLPIQHYLSPMQQQHNTIMANSHWWPPSLHFSMATLTAAEWSDSEWKLSPHSSQDSVILV